MNNDYYPVGTLCEVVCRDCPNVTGRIGLVDDVTTHVFVLMPSGVVKRLFWMTLDTTGDKTYMKDCLRPIAPPGEPEELTEEKEKEREHTAKPLVTD